MRDSTVYQNNGRIVEAGASSVEKDFVSSIKAATEVPRSTFEFHVWSDEGVSLHVDLNSSPSDWTNRFRNEVRISENVNGSKSRSLWQDLSGLGENSTRGKLSFFWNTKSSQIDDRDGLSKSSSSLKLSKDGVAELDQQNKGDRPLISGLLTPCSVTVKVANNLQENQSAVSAEMTVNAVDNLMQDQSTVSAEVSYGAQNHFISGAESCAKDTSKKILASDASNAPFNKSLVDSVGNSLSDPGTLELQHSNADNECSEDCGLPNGSCSVNPGVVCAGASLSSSVELQNSEVASCHKYASASLCDNDGNKGGLVNSNEINFITDGNNFTSLTEEWEAAKTVNGRDSSECSQFHDPLKKCSLGSDDQMSKTELHKKRKNTESEIQCSSDKPASRILRSMMKKSAVMVLPRRSMRLISKLLSLFTETCKSYLVHLFPCKPTKSEFMKRFVSHLKALVPDFSLKL